MFENVCWPIMLVSYSVIFSTPVLLIRWIIHSKILYFEDKWVWRRMCFVFCFGKKKISKNLIVGAVSCLVNESKHEQWGLMWLPKTMWSFIVPSPEKIVNNLGFYYAWGLFFSFIAKFILFMKILLIF